MSQQHLFETPPVYDPRDEWRTPPGLFGPLNSEFGFGWDLAASKDNHLCLNYYTITNSALDHDWTYIGGPAFCNPPFSDLPRWVKKAAMSNPGRRHPIVMLMPATRNDQDWFHEHVIGVAAELRPIRGRVAYGPAPGIEASSPSFGSQLVIWRPGHTGPTTVRSQEHG